MSEYQKAQRWLESIDWDEFPEADEHLTTICEALQEMDRNIPMKPLVYDGTNRADCPICGATVRRIGKPFGHRCSKCGQKLDWSD